MKNEILNNLDFRETDKKKTSKKQLKSSNTKLSKQQKKENLLLRQAKIRLNKAEKQQKKYPKVYTDKYIASVQKTIVLKNEKVNKIKDTIYEQKAEVKKEVIFKFNNGIIKYKESDLLKHKKDINSFIMSKWNVKTKGQINGLYKENKRNAGVINQVGGLIKLFASQNDMTKKENKDYLTKQIKRLQKIVNNGVHVNANTSKIMIGVNEMLKTGFKSVFSYQNIVKLDGQIIEIQQI